MFDGNLLLNFYGRLSTKQNVDPILIDKEPQQQEMLHHTPLMKV